MVYIIPTRSRGDTKLYPATLSIPSTCSTSHVLSLNPYGYSPRRPTSSYSNYEVYDDYVEAKRLGYLKALHQQQQHREYQRAVALENRTRESS
jgi:tRNA A37 methylthiotransferase MiaB